ncbi:DUF898 family protein [Arsenicitalea aurantiaca]|uniref:DUF898 family protein n=1 Tax=Arsenicitalea aurantiaca TaxID=1783274 RepID=A0A433XAQ0_9HYPH|nr:DUF898 family protein [Arsenicitalea aurantiaca]RUT31110.1 DUF898 family protein [Arsenicitalea aurantiaca]
MSESGAMTGRAGAEFTGTRSQLLGILLTGYLLLVPTLGIYRFWVVTWKRRFYWHNTIIGGEPLEYTGTALQLLIGFLFALGFFLPLYILFFYLSTQAPQVIVLGYAGVGVVLWFLAGYAIYRARDFRLSRTLWRGIRFDQRGSAWVYALRRFGWTLAMIVTLGLAYPFMAADLWRYRYAHSWYGDRRFGFSGSWRQLALPYYGTYFLVAALVVAGFVFLGADGATRLEALEMPSPGALGIWALAALVAGLGYYRYRARELSAMFSAVSLGEARLAMRIRGRSLMLMTLSYGFWVVVVLGVLLIAVIAAIMVLDPGDMPDPETAFDIRSALGGGWLAIAGLVGGYLGVLATLSLLGELIFGLGFWRLVVRGATIENLDSLATVRAAPEDRSLAGEGLADALNVGAY